jgi:hypothetical protein
MLDFCAEHRIGAETAPCSSAVGVVGFPAVPDGCFRSTKHLPWWSAAETPTRDGTSGHPVDVAFCWCVMVFCHRAVPDRVM